MSEDRTIIQRVEDLDRVEAMIDRIAADDIEAAAARRVLGTSTEADRLSAAYAPSLPPPPVVGQGFDYLAHARAAVARYTAWVDSYPDDDPTPRPERERALRSAKFDLRRLGEGT